MTTQAMTSAPPKNQWTPRRYRRVLILATVAPILTWIAMYQVGMDERTWPIGTMIGIELAGVVLVRARTTPTMHSRLWMVLAALPIAFWTLIGVFAAFMSD
jgi:hypothetical protein